MMTTRTIREKTTYDRVIVEDPYRSEAIAAFVENLVRKENSQPGIVFVRKKRHAALLAQVISTRLSVEVPAITSDVAKGDRNRCIEEMKAGRLLVAVCTDVWSTGIDIPRLAWVLLAGAGQAPAGFKQRAGRGTRLHEEKAEYVVYSWEDTGPDTETYQEQSALRLEHLSGGGFSVEGVEPVSAQAQALDESDVDVDLLQELLAQTPAKQAIAAAVAELEPEEEYDDTWAAWRFYVFGLLVAVIVLSSLSQHC